MWLRPSIFYPTSFNVTQHTFGYSTVMSWKSEVLKTNSKSSNIYSIPWGDTRTESQNSTSSTISTGFLRNEDINFWQTLRITPERTLKDVLEKCRKNFAEDDFKEFVEFLWDQLVYDSSKQNFSDFFKTLRETATQTFGDAAAELVETFLFRKLPVQIQNELSTVGISEASVGEIKSFI